MVADATPVYVEPGWLLYVRNDRIVARRFDAAARKLIGEPIALADEPDRSTFLGSPVVLAGLRGPLAYARAREQVARLEWSPLNGGVRETLPLPPGPYGVSLALSPEGRRLVVERKV